MSNTNPLSEEFDWFAFLRQDPKNVSLDDICEASELATDWPTCACGQLCKALPRGALGEPKDEELVTLGISFSECLGKIVGFKDEYEDDVCETRAAVLMDHWLKAAKIMTDIESRSSRLLLEMSRADICTGLSYFIDGKETNVWTSMHRMADDSFRGAQVKVTFDGSEDTPWFYNGEGNRRNLSAELITEIMKTGAVNFITYNYPRTTHYGVPAIVQLENAAGGVVAAKALCGYMGLRPSNVIEMVSTCSEDDTPNVSDITFYIPTELLIKIQTQVEENDC